MRHAVRVLVLLSLLATPLVAASGYRIFFKDGSSVAALDQVERRGDLAVITLLSGTQTTVPFSEIDVERSDEHNRRAFGDAVVIDGGTQRALEIGDRERVAERTLRDVILERQRREAQPRRESTADEQQIELRKTAAGFNDLRTLPRRSFESDETTNQLMSALRSHGLRGFAVYRGSRPGRALIEITTDSQSVVFAALESVSRALVELTPESGIQIIELELKTSQGSPAGMFTLSPDNAALLAKERIEPGEFFLQHVEF